MGEGGAGEAGDVTANTMRFGMPQAHKKLSNTPERV